MISYMVDGQGFLIISREVVSEDVEVRSNRNKRSIGVKREGEGVGVDLPWYAVEVCCGTWRAPSVFIAR